jgi:hypothetical protein
MFQTGLVILSVVLIGYIVYKVGPLIISKYYSSGTIEQFQKSTPSPVVSRGVFPPAEAHRVISPGGPNPPNAAAPKKTTEVKNKVPDENANDPLAETNTEVPMKDNLRQPERMFSAPPPNKGTKQGIESGISGDTTNSATPSGKFSPDFAQNGGEFMNGIFANDLTSSGNTYSDF